LRGITQPKLAKTHTKISIDLGLDDIKVKQMSTDEQGNYHIHVACTVTVGTCPHCNKRLHQTHGHCQERVIEHIPILEKRVFIHARWPRFVCLECHQKTTSFHPQWLNKTGNKTIAFEHYVLKQLINSTVSDVSVKLQLTNETVDGIVNRHIKTDYDWSSNRPRVIGLDEIALRKGHNHYLTIVTDLTDPHGVKIITVLDGRTKEDLEPFLKSIPRERLLGLDRICIDMGASDFAALKAMINDDVIFNHIVTIDRFHVAKLIGEKVDKRRKKLVAELKQQAQDDPETLEQIKGTMWPFRHHPKDIDDNQAAQLNVLFDLSDELKAAYDCRESLFEIFEQPLSKAEAKLAIDTWVLAANPHSVFQSFIDTYRRFEPNILNDFTSRKSSGPVEGMNNKIKVIKRRGYGFTNVINFAKRLFLDINCRADYLPC